MNDMTPTVNPWVEVLALKREWVCQFCFRRLRVGDRAFADKVMVVVECPECRAEGERAERARAEMDRQVAT